MTKPQIFTAVFFVLLLLLLYQIVLMFRPFLFPVLWAALLAHLTFPLHVRLTAFVRGREVVSASCLTLLVLALVVIPISMMAVLLAREASTAEQTIREWISSGALHKLPEQLGTWPVIGGLLQRVSGSVLLTPDSLEQGLLFGRDVPDPFLSRSGRRFAEERLSAGDGFLSHALCPVLSLQGWEAMVGVPSGSDSTGSVPISSGSSIA